jgi:hypothetical protein
MVRIQEEYERTRKIGIKEGKKEEERRSEGRNGDRKTGNDLFRRGGIKVVFVHNPKDVDGFFPTQGPIFIQVHCKHNSACGIAFFDDE